MSDAPPITVVPERRLQERRILRTPVRILLPGVEPVEGRSVDISVGGIAVVAHGGLKSGTWCRLNFSLMHAPGRTVPVDAVASITNCVLSRDHDGYKIGMQFKDLPQPVQLVIMKYVRS